MPDTTTSSTSQSPRLRTRERSRLRETNLADFETFYADVRSRLVLQTWALTGDLPAAQKASRDALAIAWQHWRRVRRLDSGAEAHIATAGEQEDFVRPIAWTHALRRHSVPHLPRQRSVDPTIRRILHAITRLPLNQRKVVLLTHLTTNDLESVAREVGVSASTAEQLLLQGVATLTHDLDLASPEAILGLFAPLAARVEELRWPRTSIIARTGDRRRQRLVLGAVAASVVVAVAAGTFVTDTTGDANHPSLKGVTWVGDATHVGPAHLSASDLLGAAQVRTALAPADTTAWKTSNQTLTSSSTEKSSTWLPCQQAPIAGSAVDVTTARLMTTASATNLVGEHVEVASAKEDVAATIRTVSQWYGGCRNNRVQLGQTWSLTGAGDDARLVQYQDFDKGRTLFIGFAHSGVLTVTVATSLTTATKDTPTAVASLLSQAISKVCHLRGGGTCGGAGVGLTATAPLPTGTEPGLVSELDLPPVATITQPWVGAEPTPATTNAAATHCDQTSFKAGAVKNAFTRTFVIPSATQLPAEFGLTETAGDLTTASLAQAFTQKVRASLAACPQNTKGVSVAALADQTTSTGELAAWSVTVETSQTASITYLMAIVRDGHWVGQVGFVPSGAATISNAAFIALAGRAAQRLPQLP